MTCIRQSRPNSSKLLHRGALTFGSRGARVLVHRAVVARKHDHVGVTALAAISRLRFLTAEMALELRSSRAYLSETIRRVGAGDPEAMLDVLRWQSESRRFSGGGICHKYLGKRLRDGCATIQSETRARPVSPL